MDDSLEKDVENSGGRENNSGRSTGLSTHGTFVHHRGPTYIDRGMMGAGFGLCMLAAYTGKIEVIFAVLFAMAILFMNNNSHSQEPASHQRRP